MIGEVEKQPTQLMTELGAELAAADRELDEALAEAVRNAKLAIERQPEIRKAASKMLDAVMDEPSVAGSIVLTIAKDGQSTLGFCGFRDVEANEKGWHSNPGSVTEPIKSTACPPEAKRIAAKMIDLSDGFKSVDGSVVVVCMKDGECAVIFSGCAKVKGWQK